MAIDLSKKRIIMIHGLASKPPSADVHDLWSKFLVENIRLGEATMNKAYFSGRRLSFWIGWAFQR